MPVLEWLAKKAIDSIGNGESHVFDIPRSSTILAKSPLKAVADHSFTRKHTLDQCQFGAKAVDDSTTTTQKPTTLLTT